jgi:2,3-bisphosphoglycerate-independent phosphoglycerate mutase
VLLSKNPPSSMGREKENRKSTDTPRKKKKIAFLIKPLVKKTVECSKRKPNQYTDEKPK